MESPRLSIASSSSSGDSCSNEVQPQNFYPPPSLTVDSLVVNKGATGILNGNLSNITLNQFIVPKGDEWDPSAVNDLVTDAIRINTETNSKFFPIDSPNSPIVSGKKEDLQGLQRRWCYLIAALVALSFVTLLSTSVFSLTNYRNAGSYARPSDNLPSTGDVEDTSVVPADLEGAPRFMSRTVWLAQPPSGSLANNSLPVKRVVVCHTASESCSTTPECILLVRHVQMLHVESRRWADIGYNFLIGGDGGVYVGRGWDKMGAHTKGHNNSTLGVAFVGTYTNQMPNDRQLDAFNKLVDVGLRIDKISANYTVVAQCQLQVTAAPGLTLATNMTSWPHFDTSLPLLCTY